MVKGCVARHTLFRNCLHMFSPAMHGVADHTSVHEGDLLWAPSLEWIERTQLTAFTRWAEERTGRIFANYAALWTWSTAEIDELWQAIWDFFDVRSSAPHTAVLEDRAMPGVRWFLGARLNYAEHVLRQERAGEPALLYLDETEPVRKLPWEEFGRQVRRVATYPPERSGTPGDRVVAHLPNIPEPVVAMVATASIGGVWAGVSPDFGTRGALDRPGQLEPTVLVAADGYRYGGRDFDRWREVAEIVAGLPALRVVVQVSMFGTWDGEQGTSWTDVLAGPAVPSAGFECEQVAFDHPLWVLCSSGTTGLSKAIVQGHGGILLVQLKLQSFRLDLQAGDRAFFSTTTGWMMRHFLVSMLLVGAVPVPYDGNPAHPNVDVLWRAAQDSRARLFGASPQFRRADAEGRGRPEGPLRPQCRRDGHARRVARVTGDHRVVLCQGQGRPLDRHRQRRNGLLHRVCRRRVDAPSPRWRDPGPVARSARRGLGRHRSQRRWSGGRAGDHRPDALHARHPVE